MFLVVVVYFWVGCTVADLANCVPIKYVWINSLSDPRYCFNYNMFWFSSGISEAVLDVLVILLPIKVVHGLQLSTRKKVAVAPARMLTHVHPAEKVQQKSPEPFSAPEVLVENRQPVFHRRESQCPRRKGQHKVPAVVCEPH